MTERTLPFVVLGITTAALAATAVITNFLIQPGYHTGHQVDRVMFSADGKTLVGFGRFDSPSGEFSEWNVWDTQTGAHTAFQSAQNWTLGVAALSPNAQTVVVCRESPRSTPAQNRRQEYETWIAALDTTTGKERWAVKIEKEGFTGNLAFSPDGTRLIAIEAGVVVLRDPASGKELYRWDDTITDFHEVQWLPDGSALLVHVGIGDDLKALQLRTLDGTIVTSYCRDNDWIEFASSPNGKQIAVFQRSKSRLALYARSNGKLLASISVTNPSVIIDRFLSDDRLAYHGGEGDDVWVWEIAAKKLRAAKTPAEKLAPQTDTPDGKRCAVPSSDPRGPLVRLLDTQTGQTTVPLAGEAGFPQ